MPLQAEGEFALVMEKLESVLSLPGQPVKRGTMAHEHIVYMMLTEAATRIPDTEALKKYATKLEELSTRDGHQPYLAVAHRAWGIVHRLAGDYEQSWERQQKALVIFDELDAQWQIGRTLIEIAALKLAQGHTDGAREQYTLAMDRFETLQAGPDLTFTQTALAELA